MAVVAHAFNHTSWEAETTGSLRVRGQPDMQDRCQSYPEKPRLEKPINKPTNKQAKQKNQDRQDGSVGKDACHQA